MEDNLTDKELRYAALVALQKLALNGPTVEVRMSAAEIILRYTSYQAF